MNILNIMQSANALAAIALIMIGSAWLKRFLRHVVR